MKVSDYFTTFVRMTGKEAAKYLGVHRSALCLMVKDGLIRVTPDPNHSLRLVYNDEDVESVDKARRKLNGKHRTLKPNPQSIVQMLGYNWIELCSPCRFRRVVDQRRIVASILSYWGYTLNEIGGLLNRNHSTVINLLNSSYLVEDEVNLAIKRLSGESEPHTNTD